jgi:hypothetical protein
LTGTAAPVAAFFANTAQFEPLPRLQFRVNDEPCTLLTKSCEACTGVEKIKDCSVAKTPEANPLSIA